MAVFGNPDGPGKWIPGHPDYVEAWKRVYREQRFNAGMSHSSQQPRVKESGGGLIGMLFTLINGPIELLARLVSKPMIAIINWTFTPSGSKRKVTDTKDEPRQVSRHAGLIKLAVLLLMVFVICLYGAMFLHLIPY